MDAHTNSADRRRQRLWTVLAIAAIGTALLVSSVAYLKLYRERPAPHFESDEDHFLFGSVGTEREQGIPYWVWLVLPRIFPEYLPRPGGYAALGMVNRDGTEMPAGFSRMTIGYPRVGPNCALCHTARWRERPTAPPTIVPAGPAQQIDVQAYRRFLLACATDTRFNAGTILGEIARNYRLSLLDRALYRFFIIPSTRRRLLALDREGQWMHRRADWGRGRADVVSDSKVFFGPASHKSIGTVDNPPLWSLAQRDGRAFFWDGSSPSVKESVRYSALAMGVTPGWLFDAEVSLTRVQRYISGARPPAYPFPLDQALAEQGRTVFRESCSECHATDGARTAAVIPIGEIGTDRHRLDAWTPDDATRFNTLGTGRQWKLGAFRKSDGYVAVPLNGLWLRAPYLHNGSVPSLADLLEPPERRPQEFWRGYDVYDPANVGFVSSGPEARRVGTLYNVSRPGNSNAGHLYGTELPADRKRALLEFLKTQ